MNIKLTPQQHSVLGGWCVATLVRRTQRQSGEKMKFISLRPRVEITSLRLARRFSAFTRPHPVIVSAQYKQSIWCRLHTKNTTVASHYRRKELIIFASLVEAEIMTDPVCDCAQATSVERGEKSHENGNKRTGRQQLMAPCHKVAREFPLNWHRSIGRCRIQSSEL